MANVSAAIAILATVAGFLEKPGLIKALTTGKTVADQAKVLLGRSPPSVRKLHAELTRKAEQTFAQWRELPADAAALYEQMIEIAYPRQPDLFDGHLNGDKIADRMWTRHLAGRADFAHMEQVFLTVTSGTLDAFLSERAILDELEKEYRSLMAEGLADLRDGQVELAEGQKRILERLGTENFRSTLLSIAHAQGLDVDDGPSQDTLLLRILETARESALARQSAGAAMSDLPAQAPLLKQAQEALSLGEYDRADALLARADDENLSRRISLKQARASTALAQGDLVSAEGHVEAAVQLSTGDPALQATLREGYLATLYARGRAFGIAPLQYAVGFGQKALDATEDATHRAGILNNIGASQQSLGQLLGPRDGRSALDGAIASFREVVALFERSHAPPEHRALGLNNLGTALRMRAKDDETGNRRDFLESALAAYETAVPMAETAARHLLPGLSNNIGRCLTDLADTLSGEDRVDHLLRAERYLTLAAEATQAPSGAAADDQQTRAHALQNRAIARRKLAEAGHPPGAGYLDSALADADAALEMFRAARQHVAMAMVLVGRAQIRRLMAQADAGDRARIIALAKADLDAAKSLSVDRAPHYLKAAVDLSAELDKDIAP